MVSAPTNARVQYAALTCVGLRRDHNEDTVVIGGNVLSGDVLTPVNGEIGAAEGALFAVADGLGGHAAGERASLLVADGLAAKSGQLRDGHQVADALHGLNDEVYQAMRDDPSTRGMGTTVAGALIGPDGVTVFHVGDSRVYVRRGNAFEQVTRDDVLPQNPAIITNCLGGADRSTPIEVHTATLDSRVVVGLLMCTDGLSDMIAVDRVQMVAGIQPNQMVSVLRGFAFDAGAHDNISIIYAEIDG